MSASNRIEILPSQVITGSGSTAAIPVNTFIDFSVGVDVTAVAGATLTVHIWLQASDDGGTTWYDYPYDKAMRSDAAGTDVTALITGRNITLAAGHVLADAAKKYLAQYREVGPDVVRVTWTLAGTTNPSITMSISIVGK